MVEETRGRAEDSSSLFAGRSIEEIGAIERKLRSDIERKREDLRQMVGERYRDLIEAADTITTMKKYSRHRFEIQLISLERNFYPYQNYTCYLNLRSP